MDLDSLKPNSRIHRVPKRAGKSSSWPSPHSLRDDMYGDDFWSPLKKRATDASKKRETEAFVPKNPSACEVIRRLFMDEESADVVLQVGTTQQDKQEKSHARKRAKTASSSSLEYRSATGFATFYAHRIILKKCTTALAELAGSGSEDSSPIPIPDVSPEIFFFLLGYIYGVEVPANDMKACARDIIDAADKYGVTNLKLAAEASYVQSTTITLDNVSELLLYADAKNCALLKECAMDFIVENATEVLEHVNLADLPGGMADVLSAKARSETKKCSKTLSTMRISDLRRKAHEKGFDIDGSRETLIASLKGDS